MVPALTIIINYPCNNAEAPLLNLKKARLFRVVIIDSGRSAFPLFPQGFRDFLHPYPSCLRPSRRHPMHLAP